MADTAFITQYRNEQIMGFEQGQSQLRMCCTTEAVVKGNQATFLVVDSGGASAVTRGVNGLIPTRPDNDNQYTATLTEWHDKVRKTKFNIFASQGDGRRAMQSTTVKVLNRKIDDDIIAELVNGTQTQSAAAASLAVVQNAIAKLARQDVDVDEEDNMYLVATPSFRAELMQIKEFNSGDWVEMKPLVGPVRKMYRWAGVNWIFSNRLPGVGTASETCFLYHKAAIGHAVNTEEMDIDADYNREDSYSWARASMFMGSKVLQNKGILKIAHDGSAIG